MPTNDLHRACGCWEGRYPNIKEHDPDWGRAGALLGLGEGADPHPDAKRLCAEKDRDWDRLPLHWALDNEAPEGVVLAIIDAHPQVCRHAESRRTKGGALLLAEQGKERRDHLGRRRVPCTLRLT